MEASDQLLETVFAVGAVADLVVSVVERSEGGRGCVCVFCVVCSFGVVYGFRLSRDGEKVAFVAKKVLRLA